MLFPIRFSLCLCLCVVCSVVVVFIQLLCMIRYVSFNIEMYSSCVCVCVLLGGCRHSRCMGLVSCPFKCCMGDRFRFLNDVHMSCVCVGWYCVCGWCE